MGSRYKVRPADTSTHISVDHLFSEDTIKQTGWCSRKGLINPFTLKFPKSLEETFQEAQFETQVKHIRLCIIVGTLLYLIFIIYDLFFPDKLLTLLVLRAVSLIYMIAAVSATYWHHAKRIMQGVMAFGIYLAGLGVMLGRALRGDSTPVVGVLLVLAAAYLLIRLQFLYLLGSSLSIFFTFHLLSFILKQESATVQIGEFIYLLALNAIGISTAYVTEWFIRKEYLQEIAIKIEQKKQTAEQNKSERLLLALLPKSIVNRLDNDNKNNVSDRFASVSVVFANVVDFTKMALHMPPQEMLKVLNEIFAHFDRLNEKYGMEKIKTIGDTYMTVAGLPVARHDHAETAARMALDMLEETERLSKKVKMTLKLRVGVNCGEAVAGIVGQKKFCYDIWGDTVNVASRLESLGDVNKVHCSESVYEELKGRYEFERRDPVMVKGKGMMQTYFLVGLRDDALSNSVPRNSDGESSQRQSGISTRNNSANSMDALLGVGASFQPTLETIPSTSSLDTSHAGLPGQVQEPVPGKLPRKLSMNSIKPKNASSRSALSAAVRPLGMLSVVEEHGRLARAASFGTTIRTILDEDEDQTRGPAMPASPGGHAPVHSPLQRTFASSMGVMPRKVRGVNDMMTRLNRVTLRFPPSLELEFDRDYFTDARSLFRRALVIAFLLYILFGFLDLLEPSGTSLVPVIRYGVIIPVYLLLFGLTFWEKLLRISVQSFITVMMLATMAGTIAMEAVFTQASPRVFFTSRWVVMSVFLSTVPAFKFLHAMGVYLATAVSFTIVTYAIDPRFQAEYVFDLLYFLAVWVMGGMASYRSNLFTRRDFLLRRQVQLEKEKVAVAQRKVDELLRNILPAAVAQKIKDTDTARQYADTVVNGPKVAESFASVTVLLADIVGFTQMASRMPPLKLVETLNTVFTEFDAIAEKYGLEKIKTIGDAYMCVGGLPEVMPDHAEVVVDMALDMQKRVEELAAQFAEPLQLRIGVHSGPVVAGVVGARKFIYDLWGDTVTVAQLLEANGVPGQVHISEETRAQLPPKFIFNQPRYVELEGRGTMRTYVAVRERATTSASRPPGQSRRGSGVWAGSPLGSPLGSPDAHSVNIMSDFIA